VVQVVKHLPSKNEARRGRQGVKERGRQRGGKENIIIDASFISYYIISVSF
jgi:hypothetical protein